MGSQCKRFIRPQSCSVIIGGGGGKGTWGRLNDEMDADTHTKDYRDPNYDSADEVRLDGWQFDGKTHFFN